MYTTISLIYYHTLLRFTAGDRNEEVTLPPSWLAIDFKLAHVDPSLADIANRRTPLKAPEGMCSSVVTPHHVPGESDTVAVSVGSPMILEDSSTNDVHLGADGSAMVSPMVLEDSCPLSSLSPSLLLPPVLAAAPTRTSVTPSALVGAIERVELPSIAVIEAETVTSSALEPVVSPVTDIVSEEYDETAVWPANGLEEGELPGVDVPASIEVTGDEEDGAMVNNLQVAVAQKPKTSTKSPKVAGPALLEVFIVPIGFHLPSTFRSRAFVISNAEWGEMIAVLVSHDCANGSQMLKCAQKAVDTFRNFEDGKKIKKKKKKLSSLLVRLPGIIMSSSKETSGSYRLDRNTVQLMRRSDKLLIVCKDFASLGLRDLPFGSCQYFSERQGTEPPRVRVQASSSVPICFPVICTAPKSLDTSQLGSVCFEVSYETQTNLDEQFYFSGADR